MNISYHTLWKLHISLLAKHDYDYRTRDVYVSANNDEFPPHAIWVDAIYRAVSAEQYEYSELVLLPAAQYLKAHPEELDRLRDGIWKSGDGKIIFSLQYYNMSYVEFDCCELSCS